MSSRIEELQIMCTKSLRRFMSKPTESAYTKNMVNKRIEDAVKKILKYQWPGISARPQPANEIKAPGRARNKIISVLLDCHDV